MARLHRIVVLVLALAVTLSAAPQLATADQSLGEPPSRTGDASAADGVATQTWAVELTGAFFLESWDMNRFREQLVGGAVSLFRQLSPRWAIGFEAQLLHVNQTPANNVLMPALNVMLRWTALELGQTSVFVEGGAGPTYATGRVPDHGTQFNIVAQTGVGLSRRLVSRVDMLGGARWLHLSNNGLAGRWRNPDIQALGLYIGWRVQ
jgi:hypothetical protein